MSTPRFSGFTDKQPPRPRVPIFSVRGTAKQLVIVTSDTLCGVWVHWDRDAGRGFLCAEPGCDYCAAGTKARYRGYISGLVAPWHTHRIIEVTHNAAACLREALEDYDEQPAAAHSLRGLYLRLWRVSDKPTAQMLVAIDKRPRAREGLPPALDVRAQVTHLWEAGRTRFSG